ncbi:MAG: glycosyltransferase family 1 protein [Smithella sp.]
MGLRIGIDGRVFIGNKTGIGHYVCELCKALDRVLPDVEFYVYSRDQVELPVSGPNWILRTESNLLKKKIKNILWFKFLSGFLCRRDRIYVYWGAGSFLPFFLGPVHTVLTVYDMVYKIVPETMYRFNFLAFRLFFKRDVLKATKITTISKGTSERLKTILDLDSDAIIYPSVNERFVPQRQEEVRECLKKYRITKPYFLSVATWEPRKNLNLLLETFLLMKQNGELDDYGLVLVGGHGWKNEQLTRILGENYESKDVLFLGYVADEVLPLLYSGAKVFLFPSIYEGFGMPVLEARKCGIPVITSDIIELREAGGNGCIYINPTSNGIRDGILRLLHGKFNPLHDDVPNPTWDEGAKKMARIFRGTGKLVN